MVPIFLSSASTAVTYSDFQSIVSALTGQISVSTVVSVLASVAGVVVGLVFMWWGVRKATRALMSAFRGGRVSL